MERIFMTDGICVVKHEVRDMKMYPENVCLSGMMRFYIYGAFKGGFEGP